MTTSLTKNERIAMPATDRYTPTPREEEAWDWWRPRVMRFKTWWRHRIAVAAYAVAGLFTTAGTREAPRKPLFPHLDVPEKSVWHTRPGEAVEDSVDVLTHLYGMKIRHGDKRDICNAVAELVGLLPAGSFQLADDAEQALKGDVDHLGIRLTVPDHVVDDINQLARDKPLLRDAMTYLVHE